MVYPNLSTRILAVRLFILLAVPVWLAAFLFQVAGLCFFLVVRYIITFTVLLFVFTAIQVVAGFGSWTVSCHLFILHVIHAA